MIAEVCAGIPSDLFGARHMEREMPPPQYLGNKYKLLDWIKRFAPPPEGAMLDGFGGSQSVAFEMKKSGFAVHTADFLSFCHQTGIALIENKSATLQAGDVDILFADNPARRSVMQNFKDVFFTEAECVFLDNFRANVDGLRCPHKRALALAVMCRSLTRKTTMGHFAHLRAMDYARDPARVRRNPSLARSVRELFLKLLPQYNAAVFDNSKDNKSYRENILDLLPAIADAVDWAYFDPPYCKSHSDYQAFYHLLETFVENWEDRQFINGTRRYYPPRRGGFDRVGEVEESFRRLFELSHDIPYWLISYNNRSAPAVETLAHMARRHKKEVRVEEKAYETSRGGRGSVRGSREYLLICR
jgi:adenine-specific DNA-methyltransferase